MTVNDSGEGRPRLILVLGGARSGKSRYAQEMAETVKGKRLFVATAQAFDNEMTKRIEDHKRQRGDIWETREEPVRIVEVISESQKRYDVILVDCLTLWVSNLLMAYGDDHERVENHIQRLIEGLREAKTTIILVSNEVGLGIVPENRLARAFRDLAGMVNQRVAEVADRVILMVAGIPLVIKGSK